VPAKLTLIQFFDKEETDKYFVIGFIELVGETSRHSVNVISLDEPLVNIRPFLQDSLQGSGSFGGTDFWEAGQGSHVMDTVTRERVKHDFKSMTNKTEPEPEEKSGQSMKVQDGDRVYVGDHVGWKDDYEQYGKVVGFRRGEIVVEPSDSDDGDTISLDPSYFWKV